MNECGRGREDLGNVCEMRQMLSLLRNQTEHERTILSLSPSSLFFLNLI